MSSLLVWNLGTRRERTERKMESKSEAPAVEKAERPAKKGTVPIRLTGVIGRILAPIFYVLSWPVRPWVSRDGSEVGLMGHHNVVKSWPIIPIGLLMATWERVDPVLSGWTFLLVFVLGLLMYAFEIDAYKALYTGVVVALLISVAMLSDAKYHVPIIAPLITWLKSFEPMVNSGFWAISTGVVGFLIFAIGIPYAFMTERRRIGSRTIEKVVFLRRETMENIMGKTPDFQYGDVLECASLLLGGHLVILDHNGKTAMEIRNVFGLWFIEGWIKELFKVHAVRNDENELIVTKDLS